MGNGKGVAIEVMGSINDGLCGICFTETVAGGSTTVAANKIFGGVNGMPHCFGFVEEAKVRVQGEQFSQNGCTTAAGTKNEYWFSHSFDLRQLFDNCELRQQKMIEPASIGG